MKEGIHTRKKVCVLSTHHEGRDWNPTILKSNRFAVVSVLGVESHQTEICNFHGRIRPLLHLGCNAKMRYCFQLGLFDIYIFLSRVENIQRG